jgi:hypothetical protein
MPMNRSGRSVTEASRVMEIEDVLDAMIASGFNAGQSSRKIDRFSSSLSVVAIRECGILCRRLDPLQCCCARSIVETVAFDIPRHRMVDIRDGFLDALLGNIVQADVEADDRADLRNAFAHLARADHPYFADFGAHPLT